MMALMIQRQETMIMSKELVDAIVDGENVTAQNVFKDVMVQKVGDALEIKRKEVAKNFIQQKQETESDDN